MLGLLAHEIGVHNIPSDFKGVNDGAVNAFAPIHTTRKRSKNNTPSRGYEFANWGNNNQGRQHDHLMVADILRTPPPLQGNIPLTRANVYFQTVLDIGDTVWADGTKTVAEKGTQTAELIHLYLVDIARIIASDDGRMPPQKHALAINDIYKELFTQVVLPRRGNAHPWIPANRPKNNAVKLGISLVQFIRKVKKEKKARG